MGVRPRCVFLTSFFDDDQKKKERFMNKKRVGKKHLGLDHRFFVVPFSVIRFSILHVCLHSSCLPIHHHRQATRRRSLPSASRCRKSRQRNAWLSDKSRSRTVKPGLPTNLQTRSTSRMRRSPSSLSEQTQWKTHSVQQVMVG